MKHMSEEEYNAFMERRANESAERRRIKARKARLRNGTAACGQTLAEKLEYLKAKEKTKC